MTVYHTWALHCVVGVDKDSSMEVRKDSVMESVRTWGMVHDCVSSHFMAWHVGFHSRNGIYFSYLECGCET